MTDTAEVVEIKADPILEAFNTAIGDGEDFDADKVKEAMYAAGAKFSNINRLYREFLISAGLDISRADRNQQVSAILDGQDLSTEEGFNTLVATLEESIVGMTPQRAVSAMVKYGKANDIVVFKKPKGEGSRSGFQDQFLGWLVQSTLDGTFPTKEQAENYINAEGTKNAVKRMTRFMSEHKHIATLVEHYTS